MFCALKAEVTYITGRKTQVGHLVFSWIFGILGLVYFLTGFFHPVRKPLPPSLKSQKKGSEAGFKKWDLLTPYSYRAFTRWISGPSLGAQHHLMSPRAPFSPCSASLVSPWSMPYSSPYPCVEGRAASTRAMWTMSRSITSDYKGLFSSNSYFTLSYLALVVYLCFFYLENGSGSLTNVLGTSCPEN